MAEDYIYDVFEVARDTDNGIICRCPHCQDILGIEGSRLSDVRDEQYRCHRCSGWFQVDADASMVGPDQLAPNKGIPG